MMGCMDAVDYFIKVGRIDSMKLTRMYEKICEKQITLESNPQMDKKDEEFVKFLTELVLA